MSKFQLAPLMAVQERRVEAAMTEVRARNQALAKAEAARQAAYQTVKDTIDGRRQERLAQYESLTTQMTGAAGWIDGTARDKWWMLCIGKAWMELQEKEQELTKVQAEAAEAQKAYRRALAREEALTKLKANWRSEQEIKAERAEEQGVEDLLGSRFGRGDS